jgi:MerR family redox-sensitive transcriptional activator SoxR
VAKDIPPAQLLSIGEVAERTGVAVSALRFYDAEGFIASDRSSGGQRRFSREVLRRIAFIRVAQTVGLTLDEIREALATLPEGRTPNKADWARLSRAWRPRLDSQIALLERLRDELTSCIGCGCLSLQACSLYNPDDLAASLGEGARYLMGDKPADLLRRLH